MENVAKIKFSEWMKSSIRCKESSYAGKTDYYPFFNWNDQKRKDEVCPEDMELLVQRYKECLKEYNNEEDKKIDYYEYKEILEAAIDRKLEEIDDTMSSYKIFKEDGTHVILDAAKEMLNHISAAMCDIEILEGEIAKIDIIKRTGSILI